MTDVRPHLPAWMRGRQWINGHVQDVRDFRRTFFAFDAVCDRYLLRPEVFPDQGSQLRHWSAGCAGEDRTESLSLFIVGLLIDVSSDRPIPFAHWPGRMDRECHVETIEHSVIISPALDMEDQRHIA